ncbi:sulfotransferase [Winogradskyella maritima]|uniref:Sulfotransferase domain-containing protein n=1 Tax=Winogradskyella maritima TaxID=1517766 RepID=A0ABV8AGA4_9FLAO|nr:sulfotransferase [Winogradskyella maritima]
MNQNSFPNLYIPGAAKSGTSTLHDLLQLHPKICMSSKKEPHYWVDTKYSSKDLNAREAYLQLFNLKDECTIKGESSTSYMVLPEFIDRIKNTNYSEVKFIFILRNPIDRLYSHYWYLKGLGDEHLDLKSAVQSDFDIEPTVYSRHKNGKYKHYYQFGRYGYWLDRFYSNFETSQIKIILFEDLVKNQLNTLNNCFKFLNLETLRDIPTVETNTTKLLKYPKLYSVLQDLNRGRSSLLKPLHPVVPSQVKRFLRSNVNTFILNKTSKSSYPPLTAKDRNYLKSLYINDVVYLKKVTGVNFNLWEDFNC